MEDFLILLCIVPGILVIILFFKVWAMCNRVRNIQELIENANKDQQYNFWNNSSSDTLRSEIWKIEELIFCDQKEEAKLRLKRIQFHLNQEKEYYEKRGYNIDYYMSEKNEMIKELLESLGE